MVPARLLCAQNDMAGVMSVDGTARTVASREALIEAVRAGERVKYLHFWGHRPLPDGRVGASCLSQWWPSPFTVDGVEYATAEHWMMAAKARLFADAESERRVLAAGHPSEAKKAGRLVRGFDDEVWRRERFGIVVEGSVHKFAAHGELRSFLLDTGSESWSRRVRWTGCGDRPGGGRGGGERPGPVAGAQFAGVRADGGAGATAGVGS